MMKQIINGIESIPFSLQKKALQEISDLLKLGKRSRRWRKLSNKKDWISCKLNRCYRLVVRLSRVSTGPYICMNHSDYDKRFR